MQKQSEQINELVGALAKAQGEIRAASKDGSNPHFKSKYASLASVWEACREPLSKNGLALMQTIDQKEGINVLITTLAHASGQWISSSCPLITVKNDAQGLGSAITYMRRYTLCAMVGVAPDDDDDGQAASKPEVKQQPPKPTGNITRLQADALDKIIGDDEKYRETFMKHLNLHKIESMYDIPVSMYEKVVQGATKNAQNRAAIQKEA